MKRLILFLCVIGVQAFAQNKDMLDELKAVPDSTVQWNVVWTVDTVIVAGDSNCLHNFYTVREKQRHEKADSVKLASLPEYRKFERRILVLCDKCGKAEVRVEKISQKWIYEKRALIRAMKQGIK